MGTGPQVLEEGRSCREKASRRRKRGSGVGQRKGEETSGRGSEQVLRLGTLPLQGVSELSLGQAHSPHSLSQWGLHLPFW